MKETVKLIGNTPLYHIEDTNIYVKLEKYNIGGSIKDRAVLGMLDAAMNKGEIRQDTVLVEATSGNTGVALAMLGAVYHIPVIIIMPETMSMERRQLVKAYGATLVLTPGEKGMQGAMDEMERLMKENTNYRSLSQFDNPDNPNAHYETTGKEILDQLQDVDIFVACIGTGGTFSGVAKRLKEYNLAILCMAGEPEKSAVLSGRQAGSHKIQGIGANFVPANFDRELADDILLISDREAVFETVRFAGNRILVSSRYQLRCQHCFAKRLSLRYPGKKIVTVAPDGGEKYLSVLGFD